MSEHEHCPNEKLISAIQSEEPLVVLNSNWNWIFIREIIVCLTLMYGIFGVIVPVIISGDFGSVCAGTSYGKKVAIFFLTLFAVPYWSFNAFIVFRRVATFKFYGDCMVVLPLWFSKQINLPYNKMYIVQKDMYLNITTQNVPKWSSPLEHIKIKYLNGVGFSTCFTETKLAGMEAGITRRWENPEDGPKALRILKKKALSYIEK